MSICQNTQQETSMCKCSDCTSNHFLNSYGTWFYKVKVGENFINLDDLYNKIIARMLKEGYVEKIS